MLGEVARRARKAQRRLWMRYALRGVAGADNHQRLEMAYSMEDPWNMDSELEGTRFRATNTIIAEAFGRVGSLLELGCGEGHQTSWLARVADCVHGIDVSSKAVARARQRIPGARFAATDIFGQPWGDQRHRFDLVTACEVLYYPSDPGATIERMRHLGKAGLVTCFVPSSGFARVEPHLRRIPGLCKDWIHGGSVIWLVGWWRDE